MAHFAHIDENNIVTEVLTFDVADNDVPLKPIPDGHRWIRTSYNGNIRARFAGKGKLYDEERDIFIQPKPFTSWVYDESIKDWIAPIPADADPQKKLWDEDTQSWTYKLNYTPE